MGRGQRQLKEKPEETIERLSSETGYSWRLIEFEPFNGKYLASDQGEIYSLLSSSILKASQTVARDAKIPYLKVCGKKIHNTIARVFLGEPEEGYTVDHINRNTLDNRVENLRYARPSEQSINRVVTATEEHSTGTPGVWYHPGTNKFMAFVGIDKKSITASFDTFEEAVEQRRAWEREREETGEIQRELKRKPATHKGITQRDNGKWKVSVQFKGSRLNRTVSELEEAIRLVEEFWNGHREEFIQRITTEIPGEQWVVHDEDYMVSNLGRFAYLDKIELYEKKKDGKTFYSVGGRKNTYSLHLLVAQYFLEPPPDDGKKYEIRFKDGNRENVAADNLEWVTGSVLTSLSKQVCKNKTGHWYIEPVRGKYQFNFYLRDPDYRAICCKTFDTLREAVLARNEFFSETEEFRLLAPKVLSEPIPS